MTDTSSNIPFFGDFNPPPPNDNNLEQFGRKIDNPFRGLPPPRFYNTYFRVLQCTVLPTLHISFSTK